MSQTSPTGRQARAGSGRGRGRSQPGTASPTPGSLPGGPLIGRAETVGVNRTEIRPLLEHLGLWPTTALSPLGPLSRAGDGRSPEKVLADSGVTDRSALAWGLSAMAAPDRVLDTRAALYNAAPTPCCLYSSRRVGPVVAGLRAGLHVDHELLAPFGQHDLDTWVHMQLQFSAGAQLTLPDDHLDASQLAFLLAVVDAHKAAVAASLGTRRPQPAPVRLSLANVLEADGNGRSEADRRWIVRAVGELLAGLIRPGGQRGTVLPQLDEGTVGAEIHRYAAGGYLTITGGDQRNPFFELGPSLAMVASSLFSWLSVLSLHDIQVLSWDGGPRAQEELAVFISTEPTVWTLVTSGLTAAGPTAAGVRFGLRALTVPEAERFASRFLAPAPGVTLPDELYQPTGTPVTEAAPASAAAPPAVPPPAAWQPTHRVPAGGLPAWERPDPALAPVATLDAGLEVQLLEEAIGWGRVLCSNGWQGWVDARYLQPLAG